MKYALALLITITLLGSSGCIAAARKTIGTALGPSGKMVIVEDNWKIEPGQSFYEVVVVPLEPLSMDQKDIDLIRTEVIKSIENHGLYRSGQPKSLVMLLYVMKFTDLPGRKTLELRAEILSPAVLAIADMTADINGFSSKQAVAEAIGRATCDFIDAVKTK